MISLFTLFFISFSIVLFAQQEKRLALVIGNANYGKAVLKNPLNDAELMKLTLQKLNFDVIYATNLEKEVSEVTFISSKPQTPTGSKLFLIQLNQKSKPHIFL